MTLIECFTASHIDNVMACLRLKPDKVLYVGDAEEMEAPISRYQALFAQRGIPTQVEICDTYCRDVWTLYQTLYQQISSEDTCIIDLTGGSETVLLAMGASLAGMDAEKRKKIQVQRFDREQNKVIDCVNGNRTLPCEEVHITVQELIALHGGSIYPDTYQPPVNYKYKALNGLWKVVISDPKQWNTRNSFLKKMESYSKSKKNICLPLKTLQNRVSNMDKKEPILRELLDTLHQYGVIDNRSTSDVIAYTYRSEFLRYCVNKAGNVLEIKTLLEGRSVKQQGKPFFHDGQMGVAIDWDGLIYQPEDRIPETRNEVDVVLMHGTTPLFISCKNGSVDDGELFKLHTVATRFGGPYARKMLIATHLDRKSPAANRSFAQRAQDMGIFLVTDAAELTHNQWQAVLRNAMKA